MGVEAKADLRAHFIEENKRQRQVDEAEKAKRKEERLQKKEDEIKAQENNQKTATSDNADGVENSEKKVEADTIAVQIPPELLLTDRQREGIQAQKDKEDREKLKKEEIKKSEAYMKER